MARPNRSRLTPQPIFSQFPPPELSTPVLFAKYKRMSELWHPTAAATIGGSGGMRTHASEEYGVSRPDATTRHQRYNATLLD